MPKEVTDIAVAKKLIHLQQSAKDRNIEFNLSFNTVKKLLLAKKCYYTNITFEETGNNSRTIDRIDASMGYVEGNVVACTQEINLKKTNLTSQEIMLLAKKIQSHEDKLPKKSKPVQSPKPVQPKPIDQTDNKPQSNKSTKRAKK